MCGQAPHGVLYRSLMEVRPDLTWVGTGRPPGGGRPPAAGRRQYQPVDWEWPQAPQGVPYRLLM
jgi:hypothetical protein